MDQTRHIFRKLKFPATFGCLAAFLLLCESCWAQTIVLASDLNGRYGTEGYSRRVENAIARIVEIRPSLVLITGDMVASQRTPLLAPEHVQRMWSEFNLTVANPMRQAGIPLAENRQDAEHVLVISHLPMWPLAGGRESEIINDRALLDLLHEYEVEVYASGHHHLFYSGEDDHGMLHILVGALGGGTRKFSGESVQQPASFVILELNEEDIVVNALPEPDFNAPLEFSRLPREISGPFGTLARAGSGNMGSGKLKLDIDLAAALRK